MILCVFDCVFQVPCICCCWRSWWWCLCINQYFSGWTKAILGVLLVLLVLLVITGSAVSGPREFCVVWLDTIILYCVGGGAQIRICLYSFFYRNLIGRFWILVLLFVCGCVFLFKVISVCDLFLCDLFLIYMSSFCFRLPCVCRWWHIGSLWFFFVRMELVGGSCGEFMSVVTCWIRKFVRGS